MATQQEWEDYFELLNDRRPNIEEIQTALRAGAFKADQASQAGSQAPLQNSQAVLNRVDLHETAAQVQEQAQQAVVESQAPLQSKAPVQSQSTVASQAPIEPQQALHSEAPVQSQAPIESQQIQASQSFASQSVYQQSQYASQASTNAAGQQNQQANTAEETKVKADEVYQKVKAHTGNYFSWFIQRALRPSQYVNEKNPNIIYLWISFALAVLLSTGVIWNLTRRGIEAFSSASHGLFSSSTNQLASQALSSVFFSGVLLFALTYIAGLAGLSFITRSKYSFKEVVNNYLTWFPAASMLAAVGFLYSFIAPMVDISSLNSPASAFTVLVGPFLFTMLSIGVVNLGSYYLVQDARANDAKIDVIWWQFIQIIVTAVVLYLAVKLIVVPMGPAQINSLLNFGW